MYKNITKKPCYLTYNEDWHGKLVHLLPNFDVSSSIYRFKEESIRHVYRTVRASVSYRKSEVKYTTSCKRNSNNKLKTFKRKELK